MKGRFSAAGLLRTVREAPATSCLCGLWIGLFLVMAIAQGGLGQGTNILTGEISHATAVRFGDLTARDVLSGQPWRLLTSTFVHFSLLHLGINLFGMYQLGLVLESWYGSPQFLGIYVLIATVGNAVGIGCKLALASVFPTVAAFQDHPSGGGSTVLCGMIALLAVVGWRSRTRYGSIVKAEMLGVLAFTAFLGIAIPRIDNFGHGGGAIAGMLVGFLHRPMLRCYDRPRVRRAVGWVASCLILTATACQFWAGTTGTLDRLPAREVATLQTQLNAAASSMQQIVVTANLYANLIHRYPGMWPQIDPRSVDLFRGVPAGPTSAVLQRTLLRGLDTLAQNEAILNRDGASNPCLPALRALALDVLKTLPTPGEISEFQRCTQVLLQDAGNRLIRLKLAIDQATGSPPT